MITRTDLSYYVNMRYKAKLLLKGLQVIVFRRHCPFFANLSISKQDEKNV